MEDPERPVFRVMERRCDQCLFGPNPIVSPERKAQLLDGIQREEDFFVCHKTTITDAPPACCRGFFDQRSTLVVRLAIILDLVEFVGDPTHEEQL